jgi:hypothetical protein
MTPTPTDSGAFDLEIYKARYIDHVVQYKDVNTLIAAVEALRERVTQQEKKYGLYKHIAKSIRGVLDGEHTQRDILGVFDSVVDRVEAAETRVVELERVKNDWIEAGKLRGERADQAQLLTEAAEARVAELEGALSELLRWHRNEGDDTDEPAGEFIKKAIAALATTSAQALERARAKDEVVAAARCIAECRAYRGGHRGADEALRSVFAKLDALGVEVE